MKKVKIKKTVVLLFRFLKNNNVYSSFIKQSDEHICLVRMDSSVVRELNKKDPENYICDSFSWGGSAEGFDHWHFLHKKWIEIYKKSCAATNTKRR